MQVSTPPTPADVVWGPELHSQPVLVPGQNVLFAGAPSECAGFVVLCNQQKTRVQVNEFFLLGAPPELRVSSCCTSEPTPEGEDPTEGEEPPEGEGPTEGEEPPIGPILLASSGARAWPIHLKAKLAACESREVRLVIQIAPTAPPGTYPALLLDPLGVRADATIQVHELRVTRIHPSLVSYGVSADQVLSLALHAKNTGNVPTYIRRSAIVRLRPGEENWHRHFHGAVARSGDQGHHKVLDEFVATMSRHEPSPIKGKIVEGAGQLLPGESRNLKLEIPMPSKLPAGCTFNAVTRIGDGVLNLVLYGLKAQDPETDPQPEEVVQ